mgnify:FL=1
MEFSGWLTAVVFLPLAGAIIIALSRSGDRTVRVFAGAVALSELALSIVVFALYYDRRDVGGVQLIDRI